MDGHIVFRLCGLLLCTTSVFFSFVSGVNRGALLAPYDALIAESQDALLSHPEPQKAFFPALHYEGACSSMGTCRMGVIVSGQLSRLETATIDSLTDNILLPLLKKGMSVDIFAVLVDSHNATNENTPAKNITEEVEAALKKHAEESCTRISQESGSDGGNCSVPVWEVLPDIQRDEVAREVWGEDLVVSENYVVSKIPNLGNRLQWLWGMWKGYRKLIDFESEAGVNYTHAMRSRSDNLYLNQIPGETAERILRLGNAPPDSDEEKEEGASGIDTPSPPPVEDIIVPGCHDRAGFTDKVAFLSRPFWFYYFSLLDSFRERFLKGGWFNVERALFESVVAGGKVVLSPPRIPVIGRIDRADLQFWHVRGEMGGDCIRPMPPGWGTDRICIVTPEVKAKAEAKACENPQGFYHSPAQADKYWEQLPEEWVLVGGVAGTILPRNMTDGASTPAPLGVDWKAYDQLAREQAEEAMKLKVNQQTAAA
uniref:Uncharacterized protein n=1 Tax=Chromera velia CCMP2878 TaxID=1169474 RepID=A0A0G4GBA3_9ALVE|eukprot:Cvel_21132.t1-p1 / transcript=Cvel_21132.t1 / gene=Cvel_21132 / organism=Chromera_velia_CCMP2878 / gene_product=hypothetical protein / transcript_product=hypothetical protein / location=Cvel_scaffold1958:16708-20070(+) / protein_length=482 / sequence_SO=supercontig / SO=protein_coding / is_pseudo=false